MGGRDDEFNTVYVEFEAESGVWQSEVWSSLESPILESIGSEVEALSIISCPCKKMSFVLKWYEL